VPIRPSSAATPSTRLVPEHDIHLPGCPPSPQVHTPLATALLDKEEVAIMRDLNEQCCQLGAAKNSAFCTKVRGGGGGLGRGAGPEGRGLILITGVGFGVSLRSSWWAVSACLCWESRGQHERPAGEALHSSTRSQEPGARSAERSSRPASRHSRLGRQGSRCRLWS
jgi:hypothetical protein